MKDVEPAIMISLDDELRRKRAAGKFCAITGISLALCEEIVEMLPGHFYDARVFDGGAEDADISRYRDLECDIEQIDNDITSLEIQRDTLSVELEDVKYRLGLRRDMPYGFRERAIKERAKQRRRKS